MNIVEQDILAMTEGVIAHQVNCRGVMGAGLALKIRAKWPIVYQEYREFSPNATLGDCLFTKVGPKLWVASLYAQEDYGRRGFQYTDYKALADGLGRAKTFAKDIGVPLYVPFKIGCGLGGGEWKDVTRVIEKNAGAAVVCRF